MKWRVLLSLVYPLRCPVCDGIVTPFGEKICLECLPRLRYVTSPRCFRCGKTLLLEEEEYCRDCRSRRVHFIQGRALYQYESVAASIYRFKYGNRREYADFYGEEIARYLGDFIRRVQPDALLPVPLHRNRQRARGYNQSLLLARAVGRYTGIPVYGQLLKRKRDTLPMKRLDLRERQNNLKKAFHMAGNKVKLETVIIIDDIYTTGSTMEEIAVVLSERGVRKVYFVALACGVL
ncbi:MAG: ComF family protein [Clostridium sp.]|jgi:ComF family protein|nr:ComF family protein [Clostridium sp.]